MTVPSVEAFKAAMAHIERELPAPDEQGRRSVTVEQIEKTEAIIEELFKGLYASLVKKAAVELDGQVTMLGEHELDALPIGTVVRYGDCMFVRGPRLWRELLTGWDHKNGHVFYLLTEDNIEDHEIVMTTPR